MIIYALIPARGGSKRIYGKNICDLNGYPLIEWTITHSLQSKLINKTFVSTDDQEIKNVCYNHDVTIINRPVELCGDKNSTEDAINHFLNTIDIKPDIIVLFQCTAPFRYKKQTDNAIKKFTDKDADSLYLGCELGRWIWNTDNTPINYDYKHRVMTQDKEWELVEGSDYIFKRSLFERTKLRLGGKIINYKIDKLQSIDIDTLEDLNIARSIAKYNNFIPERNCK